jgi:hypothetical protein
MKPRGRRPIAEDERAAVAVSFRVTIKTYDRTKQEADRERLPVAAWVRRVVEDAVKPKGGSR